MIKLYATLSAVLTTLLIAEQDRLRHRRDERGSVSTEQVVITGVTLLLAIAVGGAIKLAVDGRIGLIK